ncbi:MAG TPA: pyridoxal phosphate-dependent aminotransferase, partial [Gammaproteobacteria bacterium]|nr:pyridoxal phosphate-dependent aminotransferase [Gammaproteobacteria bacterium]
IKDAAIEAIKNGFTKYTAVDGIKKLKEAIIKKFSQENKLDFQLKQILVSCGAKHSLFNLFAAILNPGDEIIIPAPFWVSYPDMAQILDAVPVVIETTFEKKFKMTPEQLEAAITPKTRAIVINSPCNPTGIAYQPDELKAFGEILLKHPKVVVITDDIYEHILWNPAQFTNIVNVCPELYDRTVVVNGVSKAYAMTGWRIGYAAGPEKIIAAMKTIQSQSTSNPTSIAQWAAYSALTNEQTSIVVMNRAFKARHDMILPRLQSMPGVRCLPSDGTFYSFPNVQEALYKSAMKTDLEFGDYLLQEANIAIVPGSCFGAPGHIRLSFATTTENLEQAMNRMEEALKKLVS